MIGRTVAAFLLTLGGCAPGDPGCAPPPPTPAPRTGSTCRTDVPPVVMRLTIPSLGYSCPVVWPADGNTQAALDTGAVVGLLWALAPGQPGTIWVGGHHTSHGAPFADLLDLRPGDVVRLDGVDHLAGYAGTYTVVETVNVARTDQAAPFRGADATDRNPRLTLQTSDGNDRLWMVYADLAAAEVPS